MLTLYKIHAKSTYLILARYLFIPHPLGLPLSRSEYIGKFNLSVVTLSVLTLPIAPVSLIGWNTFDGHLLGEFGLVSCLSFVLLWYKQKHSVKPHSKNIRFFMGYLFSSCCISSASIDKYPKD